MAIYHRDVKATGEGQILDVAIYETVFNMMESMVPEYDMYGIVRERQGSKLTGIVPTNTYKCLDEKYLIIGGNGDSIFKRLMNAIGRSDLADDPRLTHNNDRVEHEEEIDRTIAEWTARHTYDQAFAILDDAGVPVGPINSIREIMDDPHYQARGMFENATLPDGTTVKLPCFSPKMSETPGGCSWIGPNLGAHNQEIYCDLLGMSEADIAALHEEGII
jgi:crotonobetainyl-CoA:carnitine CoA-transferase CaiB-like acyl-CoA transferase